MEGVKNKVLLGMYDTVPLHNYTYKVSRDPTEYFPPHFS